MTTVFIQQTTYPTVIYAEQYDTKTTIESAQATEYPNEVASDDNNDGNGILDCDNLLDVSDIVPPDVDYVISRALQYDCVIGARAFSYNDKIVIALLTIPFYLKSERDGTRTCIQNELCDYLGYEDIIVTFDVEVYRKIRSELTEEQMQRLLALAKTR